MKCKNCGAVLAQDDIFCTNCGKEVKPPKKNKGVIIAIIICTVLIIAAAVTVLIIKGPDWFQSGNDDETTSASQKKDDEEDEESEDDESDEKTTRDSEEEHGTTALSTEVETVPVSEITTEPTTELTTEQTTIPVTVPTTVYVPETKYSPQTSAEWLAFFNNAVNRLKFEAPAMTKLKETKTSDIQFSNSLANAYVSAAKDKYLLDEIEETQIKKGDKSAAKSSISPDGADFVSNLTMSDIKSIIHSVDSYGNYVVTIMMDDVINPNENSSYAKIFQFMSVDDVMNTYAPEMGVVVDRSNIEIRYSNCYATATISPDGYVMNYQTVVNVNLIAYDAKIKIITTDLDAAICSVTTYSDISWSTVH